VGLLTRDQNNAPPGNDMPTIQHLSGVMAAASLQQPSIHAFISQGIFAQPVRLWTCALGWSEASLRAWPDSRFVAKA
jgi:predicted DNA-binding transcriptional regulator AlpA